MTAYNLQITCNLLLQLLQLSNHLKRQHLTFTIIVWLGLCKNTMVLWTPIYNNVAENRSKLTAYIYCFWCTQWRKIRGWLNLVMQRIVPLFMHWRKLSRCGIERFWAAVNILTVVCQARSLGPIATIEPEKLDHQLTAWFWNRNIQMQTNC